MTASEAYEKVRQYVSTHWETREDPEEALEALEEMRRELEGYIKFLGQLADRLGVEMDGISKDVWMCQMEDAITLPNRQKLNRRRIRND